ncbi:MAG: hypothetical protein OXK16_14665 [bacterium]|nr:hypothetical protein [bacterium]MDE0290481.1 hypothetical protein [bacterium]MDE0377188.1 hypothetical protein [bacterium]
MATATQSYVDAHTDRLNERLRADQAKALLRIAEYINESNKARSRETMWMTGVLLAAMASVAGLIIAVLR